MLEKPLDSQPPRLFTTYVTLMFSSVLPLMVGISHPAIAVYVNVTYRRKKTVTQKSEYIRQCWLAWKEPLKGAMFHVSLTNKNTVGKSRLGADNSKFRNFNFKHCQNGLDLFLWFRPHLAKLKGHRDCKGTHAVLTLRHGGLPLPPLSVQPTSRSQQPRQSAQSWKKDSTSARLGCFQAGAGMSQ